MGPLPPTPPSATPFGSLQAGLRAHEWIDPANRLPVGHQSLAIETGQWRLIRLDSFTVAGAVPGLSAVISRWTHRLPVSSPGKKIPGNT